MCQASSIRSALHLHAHRHPIRSLKSSVEEVGIQVKEMLADGVLLSLVLRFVRRLAGVVQCRCSNMAVLEGCHVRKVGCSRR